jgi:hypothetical protein
MGEGIIKRLLGSLREAGDRIPDVRRGGNTLRYRITDALMCAFAVFFFLYPSLLHFQRAMQTRRRCSNLETLFGVSEIPWDNTIRELKVRCGHCQHVRHLASCGREWWKLENEHTHVLRNRGYNLQHNFGHGEKHGYEIFFMLKLIGFRVHTILELGDRDFREARKYVGRRDMFFYEMHAALRYALHETLRDFLVFIRAEVDLERK